VDTSSGTPFEKYGTFRNSEMARLVRTGNSIIIRAGDLTIGSYSP
jgi:hypothetical protein